MTRAFSEPPMRTANSIWREVRERPFGLSQRFPEGWPGLGNDSKRLDEAGQTCLSALSPIPKPTS